KVGSSKVQKTNVRIVAATNVDMQEAIAKEKFREDLYYRLSTVEIAIPPLRDRKEDIPLLFRKFAADFAEKYRMPPLRLDEHAQHALQQYRWSGNIRQLRNIAEQMSVLETEREIGPHVLRSYLPEQRQLPSVVSKEKSGGGDFASEREILYKVLFDMRADLNDLKKLTHALIEEGSSAATMEKNQGLIDKIYGDETREAPKGLPIAATVDVATPDQELEISKVAPSDKYDYAETAVEEEPLSLLDKEIEMIKQALSRSKGKRKKAAEELGISERTLYRKIKQYNLTDEKED
ncbi:MAG: helix-turn-helix domain-containing protein, partial [Flavobacteriaceae bacterium]